MSLAAVHGPSLAKAEALAAPAGAAGAAPTPDLLPAPAPLAGPGIDAALGALFTMMSSQRQADLQTGKSRVNTLEQQKQQALKKQEDDQARAEAAAHSGGFFSSVGNLVSHVMGDATSGRLDKVFDDTTKDVQTAMNSPAFWSDLEKGALVVAKVAAVVASVAATVATAGGAGATLALAAVLLSAGGEVVIDTQCLGNASGDVGMGMQLGGAVLGGGSAAVSLASSASSAATAGSTGLKALQVSAETTSGAATVVAGGAHIENAHLDADALRAGADALDAQHHREALERLTSWVVDDMKSTDKAHQKQTEAVQGAIQENDRADAATVSPTPYTAPVTLRG